MRDSGDGDAAVVLLHGLTGSGEAWSADYDVLADGRRLVVPDLLGFGGSLRERGDFSLDAHLCALDAMFTELGMDGLPLTVAGHSMGGVLALHWSARRAETTRVVSFCAPLYRDRDEADTRIGQLGVLERLLALETPLSHHVCAWMCRHRRLAQWLAVASSPRTPVPVARRAALHSWESYLGGMNGLIRDNPWEMAVQRLNDRGVDVLLCEGAADGVPVPGRAEQLAKRHRTVRADRHPSAAHDLPLSDPGWCVDRLTSSR